MDLVSTGLRHGAQLAVLALCFVLAQVTVVAERSSFLQAASRCRPVRAGIDGVRGGGGIKRDAAVKDGLWTSDLNGSWGRFKYPVNVKGMKNEAKTIVPDQA